jgi:hypothetical protein
MYGLIDLLFVFVEGLVMPKSAYNPDEFFFSDEDDSFLEQRLEKFSKIDSKAKSHRSTITRLMPLIRGCRDKGHSWEFIAGIFQERYPGLSAALLRKVVYEIEPSLKPSIGKKTVHELEPLIPELDEPMTIKAKQSKSVEKVLSQE